MHNVKVIGLRTEGIGLSPKTESFRFPFFIKRLSEATKNP